MHDLVIRNGLVVDGTGAPAREADVAVSAGKIVEVAAPGTARQGHREVDARGLLVTPGFVDVHTHYDAQASWDPWLTPSGFHGCTTVVMGNCGVGFAPAKPDKHDWLMDLMEGVEDIPGSAMVDGMKWDWESFPEYLDALEKMPRAIDLGAQVAHGALRAYVMGERGAKNEDATRDDLEAMHALTREALRAGALGFSTSRTSLHKSKAGELVPGTTAGEAELFAIGRALAEAGHGVFQLAAEHTDVVRELGWMRRLARETGRTVSVNVSQTDAAPRLYEEVLAGLEAAAEAGEPVVGQVAGRAIGVIMGLELTANPLLSQPSYLGIAAGPLEARIKALRESPELRARIANEDPIDLGPFGNLITRTFGRMFPIEGNVDYEPAPEASVAAMAKARGVSPRAVLLEALLRSDGRGLVYFPLFNYVDGDLEVVRKLHLHPSTRMGLSDAGAHCGAICDGGMPTFMLTHWARDRRRGRKLPLEHVVRRQTAETAALYGLNDRGVIAPGMRADLNVIDFDKLALAPVEVAYDLPAGGRRLLQRAKGYVATFVNGVAVLEQDAFTNALPGKLLRGPQRATA